MEVTALCIRQLMNVLFLLSALGHRVDSVFLRVNPDRPQFFEYELVTFHCEGFSGSTGWKVVHKFKGEVPSCKTTSKVTSKGWSCTIGNIYPDDSGEHWCESGGGKRSNSINITVTYGSVILESPVLPVVEGKAVNLSCRNKTTSSNLIADFYKDGVLIRKSSTREMIIHNVSKSDEGLYKCNISDVGESPETWLAVREDHKETTSSIPTSSIPTSSSSTPWIVVTVLLVVLLLVVGLLHLGKGYWHRVLLLFFLSCTAVLLYLSTLTPGSGSAEDQTVSVEASAADANKATYAAVTKNRKKKEKDELSAGAVYYTLDLDDTQQLVSVEASAADANKATYAAVTKNWKISVPSAGTNPPLKEDAFYSIIQLLSDS